MKCPKSEKDQLIDKICDYLDDFKKQDVISGYEILPGTIIKENIRVRIFKHIYRNTASIEVHILAKETYNWTFDDFYKWEIDHRLCEMWESIRNYKGNLLQFKKNEMS